VVNIKDSESMHAFIRVIFEEKRVQNILLKLKILNCRKNFRKNNWCERPFEVFMEEIKKFFLSAAWPSQTLKLNLKLTFDLVGVDFDQKPCSSLMDPSGFCSFWSSSR